MDPQGGLDTRTSANGVSIVIRQSNITSTATLLCFYCNVIDVACLLLSLSSLQVIEGTEHERLSVPVQERAGVPREEEGMRASTS